MICVLLVTSDSDIAKTVQLACEGRGFKIQPVSDVRAGLFAPGQQDIAAVIIDLGEPETKGLKAVRAVRRATRHVPVILKGSSSMLAEQQRALDRGADAYVPREGRLSELLECLDRLTNPLMREERGTSERIRIGSVVIEPSMRRVWRGLHPVHLKPMEYQLLLALVRRRGAPISRTDLLRDVWLREPNGRWRTVDTHVASLRQKLGWDARAAHRIVTVFNEGYMLTSD